MDGLSAEREQGITIDVAYRFFSTERRKYIVADTPGHEQYTRNMVTGASTADLAIILIDARKGVLTQTRRHSYLVSLLGIRHVVLAVNKMDLMDYSEEVCRRIEADYRAFAAQIGVEDVVCIPMSAVHGDNVFARSDRMPWYTGPSLMDYLETVPIEQEPADGPFRMPVQWVNRPNQDFRGFAGVVSSGSVSGRRPPRGAALGAQQHACARSSTASTRRRRPIAGQAVTVVLADELDVSRGDVLVAAGERPSVADQFEATIIWMSEQPMLPGRSYLFKTSTQTVAATVAPLKYKVNVNTLEHTAATRLELNDIGVCGLELAKPIVFEPYRENRELGGFILIDRLTNATVGAGLLHFALRRAHNVHWQALDVDKRIAREPEGSEAVRAVVHRALGRRQVHHRQPARAAAAGARPAHLPARRRQRAPRAEQGSRLHRGGPRREHPPRRRGGATDGRRRPHRAGVVHLAVPRRTAHGARAARRRVSSSRSSWTRRWRWPRRATPRGCTRRRDGAS